MSILKRTREFHPDDNAALLSNEQIEERIQELSEKRATMDPEKYFTGLKRLGNSYSAAEALAFIDGLTTEQQHFGRALYSSVLAASGFITGILATRVKYGTLISAMGFGILSAGPLWYLGGKFYDAQLNMGKKRELNYLHYAIMHEKDIPRVGKFLLVGNI